MLLQLESITKSFGQLLANDDITVVFPHGKVIALLGENGAGKSTLMKVISGSLQPDSGKIFINGNPVSITSPAQALRLGIGMLHQDPLIFTPLTIAENLTLGFTGNFDEFLLRCEEITQKFGFSINYKSRMNTLSIGECQQIEIVRLLANGIDLLILDEPTTGISSQQKDVLFNAIRKVAKEGKTVIFVTHKLEDVNQLCDQAVILRQGQLVSQMPLPGSEDELVRQMFGRNLKIISLCHSPNTSALLSVDNLAYDDRSLRVKNVSFTLKKGEVIGLAGMEGSGQSGLIRVLAGLKPISDGKIFFDSEDISRKSYLAHRERGIFFLPANRMGEGLIGGLTIAEHAMLTERDRAFFVKQEIAGIRANEKIKRFNIKGNPSTFANQLSGGNQQRLMLSLLEDASKVLLLEHPTRGLDIESTQAVWMIMQKRCQAGASIIFTSSDLDELLAYSDRILVFFEGKISSPIISKKSSTDDLGMCIGGKGF